MSRKNVPLGSVDQRLRHGTNTVISSVQCHATAKPKLKLRRTFQDKLSGKDPVERQAGEQSPEWEENKNFLTDLTMKLR